MKEQNVYAENRRWSDSFRAVIDRVLNQLPASTFGMKIRLGTDEEDRLRATDLVLVQQQNVPIACRVRRSAYLKAYGEEFTIRFPTEFDAIRGGNVALFFYGFSNDANDGSGFSRWTLGRLAMWRDYVSKVYKPDPTGRWPGLPGLLRDNGDGTQFLAYRWRRIPGMAAASNWEVEFPIEKTKPAPLAKKAQGEFAFER